MAINVIIVDDHPVFLAGIRSILDANDEIHLMGEAQNGAEAIKMVKEKHPDIVVMDISMPQLDGIKATNQIRSTYPDTKVLALSIHSGKRFIKGMLDAGASGYLLKDSAPDELVTAIQKITGGGMYLSSSVTSIALSDEEVKDETEVPNILNTKLHRPAGFTDLIIRSEIIGQLEKNIFNPLTLVSAPAGYGKSILISQWLEQTRALHTWVSIDDEMNDLRVFLLYIRAAMEKIFPAALNKTYGLLQATQLPPLKVITHSLLNELDQIEQDFILVLDDYHHIHEEKINQLIDAILRFPPENMHLVLITRRDPALRLHAFRSHNRITEIRTQDLAFNEKEIISLFQKMWDLTLDHKTSQILLEKTEGWIVGLRLASMSINNQNDLNHLLQNVRGDIHLVSDFLMEEVLANQPPEMKEAMLYASIPERFSPQLLDLLIAQGEDEITQELSGEVVIRYMIKANLFIIPLDEQHNWFRFHHLFQDVLHRNLNENTQKEKINNLHKLVSGWFEKDGFISEAIFHASKTQNADLVKEIIEKYWILELNQDRWFAVSQWLPLIPLALAENSVSLSLLKAQLYYLQNRFEKIPPILDRIRNTDQNLTDFEEGLLASLDCIFCFIDGRGEEAIQSAEKALSLIPEEYNRFRSDQVTWLVVSLHLTGKSDLAFQRIDEAIRLMKPEGEPIQLSRYIAQKAFLNLLNVDFENLIINVSDFSRIKNLNPYTQTFLDYLNASMKWWLYNPEDVINVFDLVIENQYHVEAQLGTDAYIVKALTLQEFGRTEEANQVMDQALKEVEETGIEVNLDVIKSGFARLALVQGDIMAAEKWISTIQNPGIHPFILFWIELPALTICRVKIAKGSSSDLKQALELLSDYRKKVESWNNKLRTVEIASLQAAASFKLGEKENALKDLKYAIENAARSKLLRPFVELGSQINELLITLKDQRFEADFVESIVDSISANGHPKEVVHKSSPDKAKFISQSESDTELSRRERDILVHVSSGLRNKEIANKLYVSTDTVKKHLYNTFRKLHVSSRLELVNKAKSMGLIESE